MVAEVTEGDGFTTETQRTRRDAGRRVCGNENGDIVTADRVAAQEAGQELVVEALQEQRVGVRERATRCASAARGTEYGVMQ